MIVIFNLVLRWVLLATALPQLGRRRKKVEVLIGLHLPAERDP
jgi:hypothetical protein